MGCTIGQQLAALELCRKPLKQLYAGALVVYNHGLLKVAQNRFGMVPRRR